jgi:hypothetical protein
LQLGCYDAAVRVIAQQVSVRTLKDAIQRLSAIDKLVDRLQAARGDNVVPLEKPAA